jgi:hypothetical protein
MVQASDGQNRLGSEGGFECFKSDLLSRAPYKGHIFLGEVVKRPAYLGEVLNKASIEIGKPNETSDFLEFRGWGLLWNTAFTLYFIPFFLYFYLFY